MRHRDIQPENVDPSSLTHVALTSLMAMLKAMKFRLSPEDSNRDCPLCPHAPDETIGTIRVPMTGLEMIQFYANTRNSVIFRIFDPELCDTNSSEYKTYSRAALPWFQPGPVIKHHTGCKTSIVEIVRTWMYALHERGIETHNSGRFLLFKRFLGGTEPCIQKKKDPGKQHLLIFSCS